MNKPKTGKASKGSFTEHINVQFGAFNVSKYVVSYMTANLSFREVAEWFSLVTDDPKYARQDWNLDELFQRDIDFARVRRMVSQYLNPSVERAQFFNSITVVLVPDDEKKDAFVTPESDDSYDKSLALGPILITSDKDAPFPVKSFGTLSWNRDQVSAVAIDGQHRLSAIKQFHNLHKKEKSAESTVSVIFIVIDKALGFSAVSKSEKLKIMRSLFIDLNKHAVPVSKIRNLLLDDRDPASRFVRQLVSPNLQYTAQPGEKPLGWATGESSEFDTRMPLSLVDWHGDSKSKIDSGPYVASLMSLDWAAQSLLNTKGSVKRKSVSSSIDPDADDAYVSYRNALSTWQVWADKALDLEKRLADAETGLRGFQLTVEDADAIANEFSQMWGRPLTRLLTSLPGYDEVVEARLKADSLSPQFAQWYQAKSLSEMNKKSNVSAMYDDKFKLVLDELQAHGVNLVKYEKCVNEIENIKKDKILFFLVGQRAVIRCVSELCEKQELNHWATSLNWKVVDFKNCPQDFYAKFTVDALNGIKNTVSGAAILSRSAAVPKSGRARTIKSYSPYFWAGSLMTRDASDPTMDYSKVAMERGTAVIALMIFSYWFIVSNKGKIDRKKITVIIDDALNEKHQLGSFKFEQHFVDALVRFSGINSENGAPMRFLWNNLPDVTDVELRLLAIERIHMLIDAILPA